MGRLIVIDFKDGTGKVSTFDQGSIVPTLEGQLSEYSMGEDQLFAASGTYPTGEDAGDDMRLAGNCNQPSEATG